MPSLTILQSVDLETPSILTASLGRQILCCAFIFGVLIGDTRKTQLNTYNKRQKEQICRLTTYSMVFYFLIGA